MKKKTTSKTKSTPKLEGSSTAEMYKKMKFGGEAGSPSRRVDEKTAYKPVTGMKKGKYD